MRIGAADVRRFYTNSGDPSWTHKISTDIRPMLPPFLQGAKCPKFWSKFPPQLSSDRHIFELRRFVRNWKQTCHRPMIIVSPSKLEVDHSPQLWDPLAQWVPQSVKVENFLYILCSGSPRRVQHHPCYTTSWGGSYLKNPTVPYLPIRPLHFTGGAKISSSPLV